MNSLELFFSGGRSPELIATRFSHSLLDGSRQTIRGESAGGEIGCFRWGPAVHALALFFVQTRSHWLRNQSSPNFRNFVFYGSHGTPAASLSYALGRHNAWLQDMFGLTSTGAPIFRRIVNVTNPQLKARSRPTTFSLRHQALSLENVRLFMNENLIDEIGITEQLAKALFENWRTKTGERTRELRHEMFNYAV